MADYDITIGTLAPGGLTAGDLIGVARNGVPYTLDLGAALTASTTQQLVEIVNGGTGGTSTSEARANLGLAAIAATGAATDLTGNLPISLFNGGTGATSATYWCGDNTWGTPAFPGTAVPRVITASGGVTVSAGDGLVVINKTVGAATAVTLEASPLAGAIHRIKDGKGDAATNNITISPASGTIDGTTTFVINQNRGSVALEYTGVEWSII